MIEKKVSAERSEWKRAGEWLLAILIAPWLAVPALHYWGFVSGVIRGLMGWS